MNKNCILVLFGADGIRRDKWSPHQQKYGTFALFGEQLIPSNRCWYSLNRCRSGSGPWQIIWLLRCADAHRSRRWQIIWFSGPQMRRCSYRHRVRSDSGGRERHRELGKEAPCDTERGTGRKVSEVKRDAIASDVRWELQTDGLVIK